MKSVLGVLLCLVFTISQGWAISGGPDYGGAGVRTTGVYAGLLVPTVDPNSLGIFSLTIPKTGIGTGQVAIFRNGNYYPGTFQGIADPDSAKMTGVVSGVFQRTVAFTATINYVYTYQVNGSIKAKIVANSNRNSSASARLNGDSQLTYTNDEGNPTGDSGGPIDYDVIGFKQAEAQ